MSTGYLALGAIGPMDADSDRDGVGAVTDVVAVELAAPPVGDVLDGPAVHSSVSNRCSHDGRGCVPRPGWPGIGPVTFR
jgi:hypothetical protein